MNYSEESSAQEKRHGRSNVFLSIVMLVVLGGCDKPLAVKEPVGEWFDSPPNDEVLLSEAFTNSVFIIDPKSAVFSHVLKKNSQFGFDPDWCGFVRLKNRMGGYTGMKTFHVTLLKGKPYLTGLQGTDLGDPDISCRGTIFGDKQ